MVTVQQLEEFDEKNKKDGFAAWQKKEETQLMLSLLPASNTDTQRETLLVLLRSAYTEGFNKGAGATAVVLLEGMMGKRT